jgi:Tfp pilus assembly protein PilO
MPEPGQPPQGGSKSGVVKAGFQLKMSKHMQQNLIVGALLAAGIGYAYYNYFFKPNMEVIKKKTVQLEQKKKDLSDARSMVSRYDEFSRRAVEINKKTDFMNRRLPADSSIADTIKDITEKAAESNINIIGFEPGKVTAKDDYKETDIGIKFASNYRDLGNFLTKIGYIERFTNPSKVSIKARGDAGGLTSRQSLDVDMTIKIYSFVNKG